MDRARYEFEHQHARSTSRRRGGRSVPARAPVPCLPTGGRPEALPAGSEGAPFPRL